MSISFSGLRNGFPFPIVHKVEGREVTIWNGSSWTSEESSTSGRPAHQPGGVQSVVGHGTDFPLRCTLPELTMLFWRVRKARMLAAGINIDVPVGNREPPDRIEASFSRQDDEVLRVGSESDIENGDPPPLKGKEYELIQEDFGHYFFNSFQATGSDFQPSGTVTRLSGEDERVIFESPSRLGIELIILFQETRLAEGSYWPRLRLRAAPFGVGFGSQVTNLVTFSERIGGNGTDPSGATLRILGIGETAMPLYLRSESGTASGRLDLTATEYFTYGGKFDQTTGERT